MKKPTRASKVLELAILQYLLLIKVLPGWINGCRPCFSQIQHLNLWHTLLLKGAFLIMSGNTAPTADCTNIVLLQINKSVDSKPLSWKFVHYCTWYTFFRNRRQFSILIINADKQNDKLCFTALSNQNMTCFGTPPPQFL